MTDDGSELHGALGSDIIWDRSCGFRRYVLQRKGAQQEVGDIRIGRSLARAANAFTVDDAVVQDMRNLPNEIVDAEADAIAFDTESGPTRPARRVSVDTSCALTRSVPPTLRTLPSTT